MFVKRVNCRCRKELLQLWLIIAMHWVMHLLRHFARRRRWQKRLTYLCQEILLEELSKRESERNANSNRIMKWAGLSGGVGHPPSEAFCATEKTWTFDSSPLFLHFGATPKNSSKKVSIQTDNTFSYYVWVIHLSWGQFAGHKRKHSETAAPVFAQEHQQLPKENAVANAKVSLFRIFFLDGADSVTWQGILQDTQEHQQPPKRMQSPLQKIFDWADRRSQI